MVKSKMGLPELPELEPNISQINNFNTNPADSDSDEDENAYEGYERLPLENIPYSDSENDDSDPEDSGIEPELTEPNSSVPPITPMEEVIVKEVWSKPSGKDIDMGVEKISEIKEAMVNFSLPSTSFPEWTNNVPEEEWKEHVLKLIKNK